MPIRRDKEYDAECLSKWRVDEDYWKIRTGIRVARMLNDAEYGDGRIDQIAHDAGYTDSTLYARKDVAVFAMAWLSAVPGCSIFSARRISECFPEITYTHVKMALPSERRNWGFEDACDALMAIMDGDPSWDAYEKAHDGVVILPMTTRTFGRYLTYKRKGRPRTPPIFSARGKPLWLLKQAWGELWRWQMHAGEKEVEVIIREAK